MNKIVTTGMKCDFHIHSIASKHRENSDIVDNSTIDNIDTLIKKINDRKINMVAITDHDNFDYEIYKRLKKEEGKGSIKKVFPGIEFSVIYNDKIIHIIALFDDTKKDSDKKIKQMQSKIFNKSKNKALYDDQKLNAFTESKFLDIIRAINLNVVMIAHQKGTLSSRTIKKRDIKSVGEEYFKELVFLDYFETFEFRNKRNEIFNKDYIVKQKEKMKTENIRFITGSDCHNWEQYPEDSDKFHFTYLKCLPTFRGLAMAITNTKRINYVNSFFSGDLKNIDLIDINIGSNKYHIPLSKGINVIIGDNSIGKSLLIHKLTEYRYLKDSRLVKSYEKYLKDNKITVETVIGEDLIYRFDKQGNIRKMFESTTFNANSFLREYFPLNPNFTSEISMIKKQINKYIEAIINKHKLLKSQKQIIDLPFKLFSEKAKSLNIESITKNYNVEVEKLEKIIGLIKTIIFNLKDLLKLKDIESEDKEYINKDIIKYNTILKKYEGKKEHINFEIKKINIINNKLIELNKKLDKAKTDETKAIQAYENMKNTFTSSIINLYQNEKKDIKYIANIPTLILQPNTNIIGKYRFVTKCQVDEINNDYIENLISKILGKKFKNINELSEENIPERFKDKEKDEPFEELMGKVKIELFNQIEKDFKEKQIINNSDDYDVTRQLSAGFSSKIYFEILSWQTSKSGLYIIDQPEDDVSQTSIKNNLLSDFYDMSQNRQVIMITHNPQFIVNLDVDNVIFLSKDETNNIIIQNGALEYIDEKYDILKIVADNIDGGINSINERWKRYEKNI